MQNTNGQGPETTTNDSMELIQDLGQLGTMIEACPGLNFKVREGQEDEELLIIPQEHNATLEELLNNAGITEDMLMVEESEPLDLTTKATNIEPEEQAEPLNLSTRP